MRLFKNTLLLLALLSQIVLAQNWNGTWKTNFGEVRLYTIGNYVVGDYGKEGLILGEKRFDLLQGVFTNPAYKRSGFFTFQDLGGSKFRGSYRWKKDGQLQDWNGDRVSAVVPRLSNFHSIGFTPQRQQGGERFSGVYNSSFGQLKLRTQDNFLIGDYGAKGILVGAWDRNNFAGHFSNNGRLGWFRFYFTPSGDFSRGEWGWFPKEKTGQWTLSKVNSVAPTLAQVVPADLSHSGSIQTEKVEPPRPQPGNQTANQNNNTSAQTGYRDKFRLHTDSRFNKNKAETIAAMQQHVQWISQVNDNQVKTSLTTAEFTLENNGQLITSKADGKLAFLTTDRLRSYVAVKGNDVVVCFRGSKAASEGLEKLRGKTLLNGIVSDALAVPVLLDFVTPASVASDQAMDVKVHYGFREAYGRLRPRIIAALSKPQYRGKNLYVFGHSLGGAQATLCGLDVALNLPGQFRDEVVVVSGSPRVGGADLKQLCDRVMPNMYRMELKGDIVTMIPPASGPYLHVGNLVHMDKEGTLISPADISKKPRNVRLGIHSNETYYNAAQSFWVKAQSSNFFAGKANYCREANRAEREESFGNRLEKLKFWK